MKYDYETDWDKSATRDSSNIWTQQQTLPIRTLSIRAYMTTTRPSFLAFSNAVVAAAWRIFVVRGVRDTTNQRLNSMLAAQISVHQNWKSIKYHITLERLQHYNQPSPCTNCLQWTSEDCTAGSVGIQIQIVLHLEWMKLKLVQPGLLDWHYLHSALTEPDLELGWLWAGEWLRSVLKRMLDKHYKWIKA
jgi:hypothetical protein